MRVHKDIDDLPDFQATALTIGSYDGVHRGHQQILRRLQELARNNNCHSVVITFHPHPRQVLFGTDDLQLLQSLEEKVEYLKEFGIDHLVVVPFSREFASQDPGTYIRSFLLDKFNPKFVVIGYDHRFGKDRSGNVEMLRQFEDANGFETIVLEKQLLDNITISSSKIRKALADGNIERANNLLGHPYQLGGEVVHGEHIGASLGFPTANIHIDEPGKLIPPDGIYAVWTRVNGRKHGGMLYIGERPTLPNVPGRMIEVNIFNFSGNLYGQNVQLELIKKIRDDVHFESLDALKMQLAQDKDSSLKILHDKALRTEMAEVAIVILNYNGQEFLEKFLISVEASQYENISIYVADNGSLDNSEVFVREHFPNVKLLSLGQNYGFAGGYNKALSHIDTDYYVLLNSDVAVEKDWLNDIIHWIDKDPYMAAAQPKVLSYMNPEQFEYAGASGGFMDRLRYPLCRGRIFEHLEQDKGQYDKPGEVFWASGCALVIRSQTFHAIGGFDESLFAHFEEIDLCWRLKRAGYKIGVYPDSVIQHVGGGTLDYQTPFKTYLNFRNSLICIFRNEPGWKAFFLIISRLILDFGAALLYIRRGQVKNVLSIVKAHWNFLFHLPEHNRRRKIYQEKIRNARIGPPNLKTGIITRYIFWEYFIRGKQKFSEIWPKK